MEEVFRAQPVDAERTQGLRALLRMWWVTIVHIVAMEITGSAESR
jgi:hypothetical protein